MRAGAAILGLLLLGGCAADTKIPDQPAMYLDMAQAGAMLDPQAAAIMISQYRQNNGLGAVAVDPDLQAPQRRVGCLGAIPLLEDDGVLPDDASGHDPKPDDRACVLSQFDHAGQVDLPQDP